jgi:hypothetical protein
MSAPNLETAVQEFRQTQKRVRFAFVAVVMVVLSVTIIIIVYSTYRSRRAEALARAQKQQLEQIEAEAHLRWDLRTERPLDRAQILKQVTGDIQKTVIGIAIDLYEHQPPIPYTWGGKSPKTGFDSSGYVTYALAQAGVLKNAENYWSARLRDEALKPIPIDKKQPGDVIFYPGGACMFYLGGPDDIVIGMLPGGIVTGKFDVFRVPESAGRYQSGVIAN